MPNPSYLIIKVKPETIKNVDEYFKSIIEIASLNGAELLGHVKSTNVVVFEIGSIPSSTLILKWKESSEVVNKFWNSKIHQSIFNKLSLDFRENLTSFIAQGLPDEGLINEPIPTIASYDAATIENNVSLIIEGTVSKPKVIEEYREILFEIMIEQKSYYVVLTSSEGIDVLHGKWSEDIFAISRWKSMKSIHEFWYGERYQNTAIPIRIGAGKFSVIGFR